MNRMESNNRSKDIVYTIIKGKPYLEWSEALKVLKTPRTTLLRTIEDLSLLREEDFVIYKNRKLLSEEWVMNFWQNVSKKSWRNKSD